MKSFVTVRLNCTETDARDMALSVWHTHTLMGRQEYESMTGISRSNNNDATDNGDDDEKNVKFLSRPKRAQMPSHQIHIQ